MKNTSRLSATSFNIRNIYNMLQISLLLRDMRSSWRKCALEIRRSQELESLIKSAVAKNYLSATTVEDREHNEGARCSQGLDKYAGKIPDKSREAFIGAMDPRRSALLSRAGRVSFVIRHSPLRLKNASVLRSQLVLPVYLGCLLTLADFVDTAKSRFHASHSRADAEMNLTRRDCSRTSFAQRRYFKCLLLR